MMVTCSVALRLPRRARKLQCCFARACADVAEGSVSPVRAALDQSASQLIGMGRLATMMPNAPLPLPKPFGIRIVRGAKPHRTLMGCTIETGIETVTPDSAVDVHCMYAVHYEFPWFPLVAGLDTEPVIKDAIAAAIPPLVREDVSMARRWWFAYELFFERLPIDGLVAPACIPFLPPERFFCTVGVPSIRHGVLDNLLGGRDFCPFVEKFAGAAEASSQFKSELYEVLAPICLMTVKTLMRELGLDSDSPMDEKAFESLAYLLAQRGFPMTAEQTEELSTVFKVSSRLPVAESLVELRLWLLQSSSLAKRLRSHLLGMSNADLRWQPEDDLFLDRLSRVVSSVETRASEMIENQLPAEIKQRYFVDMISKGWDRDATHIDATLIVNLQQGLLSTERYDKVCKTQVAGQPRRNSQNWVSSEEHDDMSGKVKVLHHLPPPPECLPPLLDGYFRCLKRMMDDSTVDPIACATIAKIAFNTLHPLVDGNGRVQRFLFQFVLFKFGFLPRMNIPVTVAMVQDRTAYEVLQQKHVDQIMAGIAYKEGKSDEGDTYEHLHASANVATLYRFQDFTFASSSMMKLLQSTLPVIAAKAFFLQRFDWRVDELLKDDALLSPRAATHIAKVFKNDGRGVTPFKILKLFFAFGGKVGFRRMARFCYAAKHPSELLGWDGLRKKAAHHKARAQHQHWILQSGQHKASSSTGRVRWVAMSRQKFEHSANALKLALTVSRPGDTVMAVHYPPFSPLSGDLFPDLVGEAGNDVSSLRDDILEKSKGILDAFKPDDIEFRVFVGMASSRKPASQLCQDAKVADVRPYRVYVGYDADEHRRQFTDHIVQNAPCDVAVIKGDYQSPGNSIKWVGISERNFSQSAAALMKAFAHAKPGDTVAAVHYPLNRNEVGSSLVANQHLTSWSHDDLMMVDQQQLLLENIERIANEHSKDGINFNIIWRDPTLRPHYKLIQDASEGPDKPDILYVGYSRRRDRDRLVAPQKMHDVAEYVMRNAPCNVILVKETDAELKSRLQNRKQLWGS